MPEMADGGFRWPFSATSDNIYKVKELSTVTAGTTALLNLFFRCYSTAVVVIPRSNPGRRERTYAQLILSVHRTRLMPFDGTFFRTGAQVDEEALHPTPGYPELPLVIEFAGSTGTGRGHNRSPDVHVLWQYSAGAWNELARVTSQGPEWIPHMLPIVEQLLVALPANQIEAAAEASERVLCFLDEELERLTDEGRERAMSFLYDRFSARLVA
jgi:hypothetical protein